MSLTPPFTFNVEVKADKGKDLEANIVGVKDNAVGATMKTGSSDLSEAFAEVAKFPTVKGGGSPRGGRSRKGKKSKGGKSRKARKSLRRK